MVDNVPRHMNLTLSRSKFESLVAPLIDRTVNPCKLAMKDAGVNTCPVIFNEVIAIIASYTC